MARPVAATPASPVLVPLSSIRPPARYPNTRSPAAGSRSGNAHHERPSPSHRRSPKRPGGVRQDATILPTPTALPVVALLPAPRAAAPHGHGGQRTGARSASTCCRHARGARPRLHPFLLTSPCVYLDAGSSIPATLALTSQAPGHSTADFGKPTSHRPPRASPRPVPGRCAPSTDTSPAPAAATPYLSRVPETGTQTAIRPQVPLVPQAIARRRCAMPARKGSSVVRHNRGHRQGEQS